MHISRLCVRNFRNFRAATFHFQEGVNTLIGENGSGKTNAFHAIRLLLDDSLVRRATQLKESDFNRSNGSWKGHWIVISIDFQKLDSSEGCQILKHTTGHMNGTDSGSYTFYFRPKRDVRSALHAASGNEDAVREILSSLTLDEYESVFTGRSTTDFCSDAIYTSVVGDFVSLQFPSPDNDDSSILGTNTFQSIDREVSCTFVKALRDVVNDLRNYRDSPLLNLLRGAEKEISLADAGRIVTSIRDLNRDISSLGEIRELSLGIQSTLHDTAGYSYAPTLDIKSSLPDDIERLLQGLSLRVCDPLDSGYEGDLAELSLGGANLIYLSLKLLEYELKTSSDRVAHFLLIEEPESHIHTHIQKTLFEKYGNAQTQVIVSTHSTHISASSRIRSVNILAKRPQHAVVFQPSNGLTPEECDQIERYLDAVRTTLLFAKGVILVEGDAELILIPALVKKVFGVSLDELGLSLISMGSAFFRHVAAVFHQDRIARACSIITDLDQAFVPLPGDPLTDSDFQKYARRSQKSGAERAELLNAFCEGNSWIHPFYAPHTFEVDFLTEQNNREYVLKSLDLLFKQPAALEKAKTEVQNPSIEIAGFEVLRIAKQFGKGWFALQLAETVDGGTAIPVYILEAIAFSAKHLVETRTMHQMLCHRIRHHESKQRNIEPLQHCLTMTPTTDAAEITRLVGELRGIHEQDCFVKLWELLQIAAN